MELHAELGITGRTPRRVLFVGAGPLPLSSLLLASQYGPMEIDNIDIDSSATQLAARLADALQISSLRFRCVDVLACTDIAAYDAVCLAAMVGPQPEGKMRAIKHLYQHENLSTAPRVKRPLIADAALPTVDPQRAGRVSSSACVEPLHRGGQLVGHRRETPKRAAGIASG